MTREDTMSCCGTNRVGGASAVGATQAPSSAEELRETVRAKYGEAARRAASGERAGCSGDARSGDSACCGDTVSAEALLNPITANLYGEHEAEELPFEAMQASLGCGNPTALAELREGEVVLDLGSGGGIDVLLSARRVGPTGFAYGLDMTDEMLELARENARKAGAANVAFLKGEIENIPLPRAEVDVIISNCVINLSADKRRVLAEAFRVLKPGGRFAVSDVVARATVGEDIRRNLELWAGCVAGALEEGEYRRLLGEVGFTDIELESTREYQLADVLPFLDAAGIEPDEVAAGREAGFFSAFVRARKPLS
jgi:arsenite methyltransferase